MPRVSPARLRVGFLILLTLGLPLRLLAQAQQQKKPEPVFRWEDHPGLHFGKGTRIEFTARFQADVKDSDAPLADDEDLKAVDYARRRVGVQGELANVVDFQFEIELTETDRIRDAYANYKQFDWIQLQGGKFKLPFSLDENTGASNLDFVYRSRAADQLSPGRDLGVMVHGRVLQGIVAYELGRFNHDGRNARTADTDRVYGGETLAGRLRVQPFRNSKSLAKDLQIGAAWTRSALEEGFPDLRGRTALGSRFFRADTWVSGDRRRVGLEGRWRPGPFSVKGEWIQVEDERQGQSVEDTDLTPIVATGWYVSGTWALTGGKKEDGLDDTKRSMFRGGFGKGGFGEIELAVRTERLGFATEPADADELPSTSPRANFIPGNSNRVNTIGLNWYLNRWVKIQANYIRETLDDPSMGPLPSKASFSSRVFRIQLSL